MKLLSSTAALATVVLCAGCSGPRQSTQQRAVAPQNNAPNLMIHYGCPTCHVIPGVPGAVGKVGPSLDDLAQRSYLAGTLQNSPDNLVLWLQQPQQIHPGTAMPDMGVTSADAGQIAAFLQKRQ